MGQGSFNLNCVYKNKSVLEIFYAKSFMKTKLKNLYRFLLYLNLDLLLQFVVAKKKIGFWTQNSVPKFRSPSFDPQISIPKFRYPNFGPQISIPKFRVTISRYWLQLCPQIVLCIWGKTSKKDCKCQFFLRRSKVLLTNF